MKIRSFLTAALAVAMLASCSKEKGDGGVTPGQKTYMSVSFTVPTASNTRATTGTDVGTPTESAIKTVQLYIFDKTTGIMLNEENLDLATYFGTPVNGKYSGIKAVETTTGNRFVLVGINLPASVISNLSGKTYREVTEEVFTLTVANISDATNGFVMFSQKTADEIFLESTTGVENTVDIKVDRLASKVIVTLEEDEQDLPVNGGEVQDIQFCLYNINRKAYLLPQTNYVDPNWSWTSTEHTDLALLSGGATWPANFVNEAATEYKTAVKKDKPSHEVKYLLENTSEKHYQAETSYASIKLQFELDEYCTYSGGVLTEGVSNSGTYNFAEFYGVTVNNIRYFFYDQTQANDFASDNSVQVATYTNGYCYYNLFLNPTDNFDIQRNWSIKANITDILAVGNPGPDPVDPDKPVEMATNILVDLEVLPWTVKEDDHSLRP